MPLTPAAPVARLREHIKLLEQTAKLFAEGQNHPAKKTAAEMSLETTPLQLARWHKIAPVINLDVVESYFQTGIERFQKSRPRIFTLIHEAAWCPGGLYAEVSFHPCFSSLALKPAKLAGLPPQGQATEHIAHGGEFQRAGILDRWRLASLKYGLLPCPL